MQYRRCWVPGGVYFFTVVTERRRPFFNDGARVELLRGAFRRVMAKHPFTLTAMVVLPDHLHCIWQLPPGDADFASRWRLIKTAFVKHLKPQARPPVSAVKQAKNQQAVWQNRYWEHWLRDEDDFARHLDYIHYNPVKHGYVSRPSDWPYSSFSRYVAQGIYPENWGGDEMHSLDSLGYE